MPDDFPGRAKIFLAAFVGDTAILTTVRSLERRERAFYRRVLQDNDVPGAARAILQSFADRELQQLKDIETAIAADAAFHELHSRLPT
jgi:hypothetical protein